MFVVDMGVVDVCDGHGCVCDGHGYLWWTWVCVVDIDVCVCGHGCVWTWVCLVNMGGVW